MNKPVRRILNPKFLSIKKSKLPGAGKGLFTRQAVEKGGLIIEYIGTITTWKKIKDGESFNGYVFYVNRNHVIDAKHDHSVLGRYANDAKGLGKVPGIRNNAQYLTRGKKVFIQAARNIAAGEEILVGYGKEYWDVIKYNQRIEVSEEKNRLKKVATGQK